LTDTKLTNYMHRFNEPKSKKTTAAFNDEYDNPSTFRMQFMKDVIEPAIPYAGYTSETEHAALLKQAKVKLSQMNFFSHSFGAVVVAETFDYMQSMLKNKGYTPKEAGECLSCMGKLNVGNPYHITEDRSRVPGMDFNSAIDQITEKHKNIPATRDSEVLVIDRIGDSLQLCPLIGNTFVPTAQLQATCHADEQERATFTSRMKPGGGKPDKPSPWDIIIGDISDNQGHALQLYMYKDCTRLDPERARARTTGQAYPGAETANRFMVDLFESSAQAVAKQTPRDTRAIVTRFHEELAPPAVRNALGEALRASQADFERHFHR
jgi:hypothetical protein